MILSLVKIGDIMNLSRFVRFLSIVFVCYGAPAGQGAVVTFQASDFGLTPTFSNVLTFGFEIDLVGPVTPGAILSDPALNSVNYNVFGSLAQGTPSGFPAFNLVRNIAGPEFYSQDSSFSMQIAADADLSNGLQVSELVGAGTVLTFNGREFNTGRYHPPLVQLNADGTGSIRNSNNLGGVNPGSGMIVDVNFGEEYITELTFDPTTLTLIGPVAIPEPSAMSILLVGTVGLCLRRRRSRDV